MRTGLAGRSPAVWWSHSSMGQPLLQGQKWNVVVPEPPAAVNGWKGRTEAWPQLLRLKGPKGGVQYLPSYISLCWARAFFFSWWYDIFVWRKVVEELE